MSDVYRYEFDENGVCYRKPDGPFVSHDDYAAIHYERIHDLNQIGGLQEENARLKSEVERLRKVGDEMASLFGGDFSDIDGVCYDKKWTAAREGKPSV